MSETPRPNPNRLHIVPGNKDSFVRLPGLILRNGESVETREITSWMVAKIFMDAVTNMQQVLLKDAYKDTDLTYDGRTINGINVEASIAWLNTHAQLVPTLVRLNGQQQSLGWETLITHESLNLSEVNSNSVLEIYDNDSMRWGQLNSHVIDTGIRFTFYDEEEKAEADN